MKYLGYKKSQFSYGSIAFIISTKFISVGINKKKGINLELYFSYIIYYLRKTAYKAMDKSQH